MRRAQFDISAYERCLQLIHATAKRFGVTDLDAIEDAILVVVKALDRWNEEKGSAFETYLIQGLRFHFQRSLERRKTQVSTNQSDLVIASTPDNHATSEAELQWFAEAVETLSDREKMILVRYVYAGDTMGEIADTLNLSHQRISAIYNRTLDKLRSELL